MDKAVISQNFTQRHEIWNTGDLSAIPQIYATDFVAHMPKGWERSTFRGHSGVVEAVLWPRIASHDWHETVQDLLIDGPQAVARYVSRGTHSGPFPGLAATGRAIEFDEISIYHFSGGLIVKQWCLTDDLSLARQLGLLA